MKLQLAVALFGLLGAVFAAPLPAGMYMIFKISHQDRSLIFRCGNRQRLDSNPGRRRGRLLIDLLVKQSEAVLIRDMSG